ncbi:MAG: 2,3-bisphosphoglycerate-independent phosphoglycerate mutase [Phyllobacterium sp.]
MVAKPAMLVILDGWGWREDSADNAVRLAKTPNFDRLWSSNPHAFLQTSGLDVGLPDGQMGNSEVGHLNLGAGRVVMQDLPRINRAIETGDIARSLQETGVIARLGQTGGTCHLIGLISPGGVHSHQDHAVALANVLAENGIPTVLHIFMDGRDTPPQSGAGYVAQVEAALPEGVTIATVCGRYYAMDRDNRWERVTKAYHAIVDGAGDHFDTAHDAIAAAYANKVTDEFMLPAIIGDYAGMNDGDALISFNFRADRIRQILTAFVENDFNGFERSKQPRLSSIVGMTSYGTELDETLKTLFAPQTLANGLGEVAAKAGLRQLRMAESEKYPHVTYFFNGGREIPYEGEDRILVPSPKVATYDLQPEMSAPELTERAVEAIRSGQYDLVILNFANPDMVGHTGVLEAAIKAVETVDAGLGRIAEAVLAQGGALLVTADHGNCELMRDPVTGGPHTAHTTNLVPVFLAGLANVKLADGRLADVAPTLLDIIGAEKPLEMDGQSMVMRTA